MNIVSEEIISDPEATDILEKREKEGELKYEQKNALEILRKFKTSDVNKIKNMIAELKKMEKLRDRHIISIVNFMPEDREDMRTVLAKEYNSFTEEEINAILEIVKKSI